MLKAIARILRKQNAGTAMLQRQCHHDVTRPVARQVEEIRIPVPWGHIAGKWWGPQSVTPVLLCLHGYQDNAGTWDTLVPLLPPDISLLAVDFPGHGLSSHIPTGNVYHLLDFVLTVQRIVEHFGWTRVSLMGHSFGSIVGFLYSAIYPEYVEHFIALDVITPSLIDIARRLKRQGKGLDDFLHLESMDHNSRPTYTYEEAVQHLHSNMNKFASKEGCEILTRRGTIRKPDGRYYFSRDVRLKAEFDLGYSRKYVLQFASNLQCKVLFIKANQGLSLLKPEEVDEFLDAIKKSAVLCEYHTVEGGHHVHLDFPERVTPLISNFLKHQ